MNVRDAVMYGCPARTSFIPVLSAGPPTGTWRRNQEKMSRRLTEDSVIAKYWRLMMLKEVDGLTWTQACIRIGIKRDRMRYLIARYNQIIKRRGGL